MPRSALGNIKRLVVKIGSGTLTDRAGRFDPENCARPAPQPAQVARHALEA